MAKKKTSTKRVHTASGSARKSARKSLPAKTKKPAGKGMGKAVSKSAGKGAAKTSKLAGMVTETHGQRAISTLQWCHGTMDMLLKDFPTEHLTTQPAGSDNHVLWTLGHLATGYAWFASGLTGKSFELPAGYDKLFGYQSKPHGNASQYPPLAEVRAWYDKAFANMVAVVQSQSDTELMLPPATDTNGMAKDRLHMAYLAAWHDGWHQGQISSIRRALGLKSAF